MPGEPQPGPGGGESGGGRTGKSSSLTQVRQRKGFLGPCRVPAQLRFPSEWLGGRPQQWVQGVCVEGLGRASHWEEATGLLATEHSPVALGWGEAFSGLHDQRKEKFPWGPVTLTVPFPARCSSFSEDKRFKDARPASLPPHPCLPLNSSAYDPPRQIAIKSPAPGAPGQSPLQPFPRAEQRSFLRSSGTSQPHPGHGYLGEQR